MNPRNKKKNIPNGDCPYMDDKSIILKNGKSSLVKAGCLNLTIAKMTFQKYILLDSL